jgi:hypothetical protein
VQALQTERRGHGKEVEHRLEAIPLTMGLEAWEQAIARRTRAGVEMP